MLKMDDEIPKTLSEKELLHKRIIQLEAKLEKKQALEMEIDRISGAVVVMKHLIDEGNVQDKKMLESFKRVIKDKEEQVRGLESLYQNVIIVTNDEVQQDHKQLLFNDVKKDDEHMQKLIDEQKKEKELALRKIRELKAKLDKKHAFKKDVETLSGVVEAMKLVKEMQ